MIGDDNMRLPKSLKKSLPLLGDIRRQQSEALKEDRSLSLSEVQFLTHVLANGSEHAQSFLGQVSFVKVVSHCRCGCPTINFEVSREAERGHSDGRVVVDLLGRTPDGGQVGILVFADDGFLSELEIYELDELPHPFPLPTLESLHLFEAAITKG
ncbi:hypothetical protein GOB94_06165 [Granulicella sp. 5B5]|uniref:hypothetical protein n=1 Tax=Granulicella sp. 5B5 TaxID=1617967 RepID=UPI0015F5AEE6|nr:hypothetical protein [Granulicella sp. 5B5]QMV18317.1 hypothetical protein GOB94_06165 [Granulicella sp. 5B5]